MMTADVSTPPPLMSATRRTRSATRPFERLRWRGGEEARHGGLEETPEAADFRASGLPGPGGGGVKVSSNDEGVTRAALAHPAGTAGGTSVSLGGGALCAG